MRNNKVEISWLARWLIIPVIAGPSGCTSGLSAIGDTLSYAVRPNHLAESAPLNPQFQYLRAEVNGRLAFLALGYREPDGTQVYYTGSAETLHIQNGRVVRFTSTDIQIQIQSDLDSKNIAWSSIEVGNRVTYRRQIDQRPGYVFSQLQSATLTRLTKPPSGLRLRGIDAAKFAWFEERIQNQRGELRSVYGVDLKAPGSEVIYSEQCVTEELCLVLQRWSAAGAF